MKKPKDFLYERKGPWPQPCPEHPFGEAAGVIHLPLSEAFDWWLHIGSRYVTTLIGYTPIAYLRGIFHQGLEEVSDQEFCDMLTKSMLSKFIKKLFDETDRLIFKDKLNAEDVWICDFEPVRVVKTFKGIYATASKTLLKKTNGKFEVVEIYLEKTKSHFTPNDKDKWELAKYFVLQGGALCSTLVIHPLLHFPMDAVNAITKTALPKDHLLFQLLYPHLRFTLYLEKAVLTFKSSLLMSKWWMPYAPYPGEYEGLRDLLVEGYKGIKGNDSYPPYEYQLKPEFIEGEYGVFHNEYYAVIRKFVNSIMVNLTETEMFYLKQWGDYIAQWVPNFTKGVDLIANRELMVSTIAYYLFDITVGHTIDHYNYGNMNIRKIPMRLREAPPNQSQPLAPLNRKSLTTFWDFGKYEMARRLFFAATTKTALIDTEYDFGSRNSVLQPIVKQFKSDLIKCSEDLKKKGADYIPVEKIAASIQF